MKPIGDRKWWGGKRWVANEADWRPKLTGRKEMGSQYGRLATEAGSGERNGYPIESIYYNFVNMANSPTKFDY